MSPELKSDIALLDEVLREVLRSHAGEAHLELLDEEVKDPTKGYSKEALEGLSKLLELKLADFGVTAEVTAVYPGPVITRFEIQPAPGVKVSRISNLAKRELAQ